MASVPVPDPEHIPLFDHIMVWVVGSVIGVMIYFFGAKVNSRRAEEGSDPFTQAAFEAMEDRIRENLITTLKEHRRSIDERFVQYQDVTNMSLRSAEDQTKELRDLIKEIRDDVHGLDVQMARIEERLPHRRGTSS